MMRNLIGVLVAPAILVGLCVVAIHTLELLGQSQIAGTEGWQVVLAALVRDVREGKHPSPAPREAIIDLRAQTVAGFDDVERRGGAPDRRQG